MSLPLRGFGGVDGESLASDVFFIELAGRADGLEPLAALTSASR